MGLLGGPARDRLVDGASGVVVYPVDEPGAVLALYLLRSHVADLTHSLVREADIVARVDQHHVKGQGVQDLLEVGAYATAVIGRVLPGARRPAQSVAFLSRVLLGRLGDVISPPPSNPDGPYLSQVQLICIPATGLPRNSVPVIGQSLGQHVLDFSRGPAVDVQTLKLR